MTIKYYLETLNETKKLAHAISVIADKNIIVLLNGDLGYGKTQLTKYIGGALGAKSVINSPTYIIMQRYKIDKPWDLVHIDAYRLKNSEDFNQYQEFMVDNFTVIEWANKVNHDFRQLKTMTVTITMTKRQQRIATVTCHNFTEAQETTLRRMLDRLNK